MAPSTGMKRFLPEFTDPEREAGFRLEFFNVWKYPVRRVILVLSLCICALGIIYFAIVVPRDYKYVLAFFGDRQALGADLSHATMITPLFLLPVSVATFTPLFSVRTHISVLALASLGTLLAFGWPVHVAEALDMAPWLSRPPPNCTEEMVPDLVSKIVVRATVHISANIFADIAVVIFCPSLLAVVAILIPQHITHLCKARYLWGYYTAIEPTMQCPMPCRRCNATYG